MCALARWAMIVIRLAQKKKKSSQLSNSTQTMTIEQREGGNSPLSHRCLMGKVTTVCYVLYSTASNEDEYDQNSLSSSSSILVVVTTKFHFFLCVCAAHVASVLTRRRFIIFSSAIKAAGALAVVDVRSRRSSRSFKFPALSSAHCTHAERRRQNTATAR